MKLAPIAAQKSECAIGTCDNWTIGPRFRIVRTFDLAPPSGRVALGGRFPGLKPWAEFCSPCGAENKGHNHRIVAYSPSEQNHPKPLSSRHSEEVKRGRFTYKRSRTKDDGESGAHRSQGARDWQK